MGWALPSTMMQALPATASAGMCYSSSLLSRYPACRTKAVCSCNHNHHRDACYRKGSSVRYAVASTSTMLPLTAKKPADTAVLMLLAAKFSHAFIVQSAFDDHTCAKVKPMIQVIILFDRSRSTHIACVWQQLCLFRDLHTA